MYEYFILSIINSKKLHFSLFKESTFRLFGTVPKFEQYHKINVYCKVALAHVVLAQCALSQLESVWLHQFRA
jgi:hypothetical protein